MAIKLEDIKITSGTTNDRVKSSDLKWGEIPEGAYNAELVIVYPWKEYTRDTNVRVKDDNDRYLRNEDGSYVTEFVKNVTWSSTDMVFRILDGDYKGYAVKGSIATHPNMIGSAKRFLYAAKLFDVSLADLFKNTGAKVVANVKTKTNTYTSKETGLDVTNTESYVSWFDTMEENTEDDINGI